MQARVSSPGAYERLDREVFALLAPGLRQVIKSVFPGVLNTLEEIRLRTGQPLILRAGDREIQPLNTSGPKGVETAYIVGREDLQRTLQLVTQNSLYAVEEELRQGYLTVRGGHRIGFAGEAVLERGRIKTLKNISSLNFRVTRQVIGCAQSLFHYLITPEGRVYHTLIISPPRAGKTTILRDLIRLLSNGFPLNGFPGVNVVVVDERSELAGCFLGVPQNDLGCRTDVLDGCPKAEGMVMALRSLGPQVVATDEIGRSEDVEALEEVINAGVSVIATVHAQSISELEKRPGLQQLIKNRLFQRLVVVGRQNGPGTLQAVMDGLTGKYLFQLASVHTWRGE